MARQIKRKKYLQIPIPNKDYFVPRIIIKKKNPMAQVPIVLEPMKYGEHRLCKNKIANNQFHYECEPTMKPNDYPKCVYCDKRKMLIKMTNVTRNPKELKKWIDILGERFGRRIRRNPISYICLSHFKLAPGATSRRIGQRPLPNSITDSDEDEIPRRKVGRPWKTTNDTAAEKEQEVVDNQPSTSQQQMHNSLTELNDSFIDPNIPSTSNNPNSIFAPNSIFLADPNIVYNLLLNQLVLNQIILQNQAQFLQNVSVPRFVISPENSQINIPSQSFLPRSHFSMPNIFPQPLFPLPTNTSSMPTFNNLLSPSTTLGNFGNLNIPTASNSSVEHSPRSVEREQKRMNFDGIADELSTKRSREDCQNQPQNTISAQRLPAPSQDSAASTSTSGNRQKSSGWFGRFMGCVRKQETEDVYEIASNRNNTAAEKEEEQEEVDTNIPSTSNSNVQNVQKNRTKKESRAFSCAYCQKRTFSKEMKCVTANESELKKWIDILGNTFEANVARRRSLPMICLSHFDIPPGSTRPQRGQLPVANYNADSKNDDSIPLKKKGRKFKRIRGRKSAKKNDTSQEVQQNETIAENNDNEDVQRNIPTTSNSRNEEPLFGWLERDIENAILARSADDNMPSTSNSSNQQNFRKDDDEEEEEESEF
ncbi:unnamed protein product [Caenorhabditis angaria]|uniref:THAP-type domain-containing protein n=1 Tax=Caenorhabditis angaria TaxID=860376 RepID=A0A9P1I4T3_9PELO|nr:unnamed protein product [Caenorhabditis angaria]